MAWMLQPHAYTQIVRRNLYNVAYRRTGAYKGMGRLGQTSTDVLPIAPSSQYIQQNFPSVAAYDPSVGLAYNPPTTTNWLPWVIGGVLVFALIAGGRR